MHSVCREQIHISPSPLLGVTVCIAGGISISSSLQGKIKALIGWSEAILS